MTPKPPYYAVIFSSKRTDTGQEDYAATAQRMDELARGQDGYLGIESARGADGRGITVSYWRDLESIAQWKANAEHRDAQRRGRAEWYANYTVRIAKVEREYGTD